MTGGGGGREKNKDPPRKQDEGAGDVRGRGRDIETRSWGERPSKILMEARDDDEGEGERCGKRGDGKRVRGDRARVREMGRRARMREKEMG